MAKAFAHRLQALDSLIQLVGLVSQHLSIDLLLHQHRPHFIQ